MGASNVLTIQQFNVTVLSADTLDIRYPAFISHMNHVSSIKSKYCELPFESPPSHKPCVT
eukprot:394097-Pleurochrysis_carterae.AAC.4